MVPQYSVNQLFQGLILPPGGLLIFLVAGLLLVRRRFDKGWWLATAGAILLIGCSLPAVGSGLLAALEIYPPLALGPLGDGQAQAIVVLSADDDLAAEYGRAEAGPLTLVRLHYGAWLARRTGLPIVVTGGKGPSLERTRAEEMHEILNDEKSITTVWEEGRALDTWQNAQFSAAILRAKGIHRVYLVTHAWHMLRAALAFRHAGVQIIPAPTAFRGPLQLEAGSFVPSAKAMLDCYYALHEVAGTLVYQVLAWWLPASAA